MSDTNEYKFDPIHPLSHLNALLHDSVDGITNIFTFAHSKGIDPRDPQQRAVVESTIIYVTDTGMCIGTIVNNEVYLGEDPRYPLTRVFITRDKAIDYARSYCEALSYRIHRSAVIKEVHEQSDIILANASMMPKGLRGLTTSKQKSF